MIMRVATQTVILSIGLLAFGASASCSKTDGTLSTSADLTGSQLPENLLSLARSQVDREVPRLTVVFLLECSDCSSLAAIPLTKADPGKPTPVLILPAGEKAYAERAKRMNPTVPVICPAVPLGLTTDQMSVGSCVAQLDGNGRILKYASLAEFPNLEAVQKWSIS